MKSNAPPAPSLTRVTVRKKMRQMLVVMAGSGGLLPVALRADVVQCVTDCDNAETDCHQGCYEDWVSCQNANMNPPNNGCDDCDATYSNAQTACDNAWNNSAQDEQAQTDHTNCENSASNAYENCMENCGKNSPPPPDCDGNKSDCDYNCGVGHDNCTAVCWDC